MGKVHIVPLPDDDDVFNDFVLAATGSGGGNFWEFDFEPLLFDSGATTDFFEFDFEQLLFDSGATTDFFEFDFEE